MDFFTFKKNVKENIYMAYLQGKLMCSHISIHNSKPQNKRKKKTWKYSGLHGAVMPCKSYHEQDFTFQ